MLVTPPVKPERPPKTFDEKFDTLPTTEAANAEPGRVGMDTVCPPPMDGVPGLTEAVGRVVAAGLVKVGSYRHHQEGAGITIGPLKTSCVRSSYFLSSIVQSMFSS